MVSSCTIFLCLQVVASGVLYFSLCLFAGYSIRLYYISLCVFAGRGIRLYYISLSVCLQVMASGCTIFLSVCLQVMASGCTIFLCLQVVASNCTIFTGRNEVVAEVMFLQVSVIHSVYRGVLQRTPWQGEPPSRENPPSGRENPPWQ